MTRTSLLMSLAAFVIAQAWVSGQGAKVPLTPWGEPDIQGTWTAEAELSVPFERPREYGNRQVLTDAEFAAAPAQAERQTECDNSDFDLETADRSTAGQVGLRHVAAAALARARQDLAAHVAGRSIRPTDACRHDRRRRRTAPARGRRRRQ